MDSGGPASSPDWVELTRDAPDQLHSGPLRRRRVLVQVAAAAMVVIAVVAVVGVVAARRLAEAESVNDAATTADLLAESVVQPALTDGLLTQDPAALASIGRVVTQHVLSPAVVRVKIWDPQGRIVYSDEPRLTGRRFPLGADERDVLTNPRIRADVSNLGAPENFYEQGNVKLLEVSRPVWTATGKPLLFETYFRYDQVSARSGQLWRGFAGVTLGSILLLLLLLLPVLWRLLDRLKRFQDQREALLQRAVDASAAERRRIAGTLHDGVVQDLAATSFAVAGSAEQAAAFGHCELATTLRTTAGTVRTSIGGLRSLLVDIYPPNLATAGLAAALTDLAASARSRGLAVVTDVAQDLHLDAVRERSVYRVTQECLNNAAKHARARTVTVRLGRDDSDVVLDISDDGVGFDAAEVLAHPKDGHFGVRVLADVASEVNARLRLATAPGQGTRWQLRMAQS